MADRTEVVLSESWHGANHSERRKRRKGGKALEPPEDKKQKAEGEDPANPVQPLSWDETEAVEAELRSVIERGERALVTTLTKRMAEDLCEYYEELGLAVRYLHARCVVVGGGQRKGGPSVGLLFLSRTRAYGPVEVLLAADGPWGPSGGAGKWGRLQAE